MRTPSLVILTILALVALTLAGCANRDADREVVVVYTSVDQLFAEPVLKAFEEETGIRVLAVYDVEANKTTGLANRLIAEAPRPKADVFWNGEFVQTLRLKGEGVLETYSSPVSDGFPAGFVDPDGYWTGMTPRLRVFISSPDFSPRPIELDGLTELPIPADQIAISDPLFGTGSFQAAALYALMGDEAAGSVYQEMIDQGVRIEAGNSVVRDLVVAGTVTLGLVDTDDACGAIRRGANLNVFLPSRTLLIPSTVAIIKGSPNRSNAERLVDYLLGPRAEAALIEAGWSQVALHPGAPEPCLALPDPQLLDIDPKTIADYLDAAHDDLKSRLVR